ncbi:MAG: hypothetical protein NTV34_03475 [Proteobacteria bacterium]|nr:hypothetical protein [Pseudomonadota bacterium]
MVKSEPMILIIGGDSTNSEKSVEGKYISVPKRNSRAGSASNMGLYAYYATSAIWGSAPETKSWPTTGDNSIMVSANFGSLSHTMMAGALPNIKATIGSLVREIKSIPLP